MKKFIIFIILISSIATISFIYLSKEVYDYKILVPSNEVYTQYNEFDIYDIEAIDKDNNDLMENVKVYGLELLKLEDGRITEFGSFNLRYTIEIENEVVCHTYRNIKVIYKQESLGGLIYNGDFQAGFTEWGTIDWKNSLTLNTSDSKLHIIQSSVDEYVWDQSIYQYVTNLEIGKEYKIVFSASSTNNKTIKVCLAQVLSSYPYSYNVTNEVDIEITNELKEYEITFICTSPSNVVSEFEFNVNQVRLEFKFGKYEDKNNNISNIVFDNINIFKG